MKNLAMISISIFFLCGSAGNSQMGQMHNQQTKQQQGMMQQGNMMQNNNKQ